MKIIEQDTKEGTIEVMPERRIQDNTGDKLRSDRGVKRTFYLSIDVENISFHLFTGKLRLTGVITSGPEDLIPLGSHHTLEVKLNNSLIIKKDQWSNWALDRLNQAIESSKKLSAIIVSIEDDLTTLGLIRQFGIEYYGPIKGNISGKQILDKNRNKNIVKYYETIIESVNKFDDIQNIIISGPGFYKNDLFDYIKDKHKELVSKCVVENTGTGGRVGIHEVLKKGTVEKLTVENRVAMEMHAVNDLLEEIAKNSSKVTYGLKQTKEAINMGAVDKLLVLDKIISTDDLTSLMEMVENMKGNVIVISSQHEAGNQLASLGGIAAILRYSIS